jgi:3-oxoacyl-[acyl-carrier-protein] synthase II
MWMLNHVPNMPACHISIMNNAQGPNNSITQTDAASLLALGEAYQMIGRNRGDLFLSGGADAKINPITMLRQCLFSPLSRCTDPEKACRPFDRQRDGMVLGEGASVLVLEELGEARRRGAHVYAEIIGFGAIFDRGRTGKGLARAIAIALEQAGLTADDLDHVNAHGSSTVDGDTWEARGLREAFGSAVPPVFAPKSYFGNLGAAGSSTELVASLLAQHHGLLPATLNQDDPDPDCPIPVASQPRPVVRRYFLKIGCTERGQCAALVCRHDNPWPTATERL